MALATLLDAARSRPVVLVLDSAPASDAMRRLLQADPAADQVVRLIAQARPLKLLCCECRSTATPGLEALRELSLAETLRLSSPVGCTSCSFLGYVSILDWHVSPPEHPHASSVQGIAESLARAARRRLEKGEIDLDTYRQTCEGS